MKAKEGCGCSIIGVLVFLIVLVIIGTKECLCERP